MNNQAIKFKKYLHEYQSPSDLLDADFFVSAVKDEFDLETLKLMKSVIEDQIKLIQSAQYKATDKKRIGF